MKEFFGSIAGVLRKHFGMETVSSVTLRNLYISSLTYLIEKEGRDKAIEKEFSWGYDMGYEVVQSLAKEVKRIKPFKETKIMINLAWYFFSGKFISGFEDWWEKWLGKDIYLARFWDEDCPWCRGLEIPEKRVCSYPAGGCEGAYWAAYLIIGQKRVGLVRETKCRSSGDDRCEFLVIDLPYESDEELESLLKEAEKRYPEMFRDVPYEVSLRLLKGIV